MDNSVETNKNLQNQALEGLERVKNEDSEIKEVAMPVIQRARVEAIKKRIRIANGEDLSVGEKTSLDKYDRLVDSSIRSGWMTWDEVNAKVENEKLLEKQEEAEKVAETLVQQAKEVLSRINLTDKEEVARNRDSLAPIKGNLEMIAMKLKKDWEDLAEIAGANSTVIAALRGI